MISYDRLYSGVLVASLTSALINLRVVLTNIRIVCTRAGFLHVLSNLLVIGATLTNIVDVVLNSFYGDCQTRLRTTCAAIQLAKVLNQVILFWRCEAVTLHRKSIRYLFAVVIVIRLISTNTHCALLSNDVSEGNQAVCISVLEPISTQITIAFDVVTDIVLTGLFMVKVFEHARAMRRHAHNNQLLHSLFKEFLYEAVPMLTISFIINVCVFIGVLGRNTEILIHIDVILQLRLANDLLVLNRMAKLREQSFGASGTHRSALDGYTSSDKQRCADSYPLKDTESSLAGM
ncbi:hypothetical protein K493DRAFT_321308 [Basidiobolus meristosporus CBS 931.73]|uniref:Uncharacterized protein n=1 Tax=Basidiobolus meristosporus CBS 931.73 TaxID=1314790 RepID=A0A1Y1WWI5_9FUNG|nr:hypothetical protein K493DRAFT_321308 [Basidiobolus meristosporus CBS 931.73]|eukprot:ORX77921.1 hypothetical protein K493DRAFT_321308 [Basidiobolus meristosporus CBS 931.73]